MRGRASSLRMDYIGVDMEHQSGDHQVLKTGVLPLLGLCKKELS